MQKRNHHGGEPAAGILYDFSVNLNPLGPPESIRYALRADPDCLVRYPDTGCAELRRALSEKLDVPARNIVCGSGASDLIYRVCAVCGFERVLLAVPSFTEYERALQSYDIDISYIYTDSKNGFALQGEYADCGDGYDAIFITNPVNPSGRMMDTAEVDSLLSWCQETDTVLVTDESFLDFVPPRKSEYAYRFFKHYVNEETMDSGENESEKNRETEDIPDVIAIRSLTKAFSIAGLRIGYALFTDPEMADAVADFGPPWAVSGPAQAAGLAAAAGQSWLEKTRRYVQTEKAYLMEQMREIGLRPIASDTNYLLFTGPKLLRKTLLEKGFRIRDCSDFKGLSDRGNQRYFRIGIRSHEENEALVQALPECLEKSRRAVSVMVQGTMSNAGKSILAAGLCRIFSQDGYSAAPFKSQNMALNSFVTKEGLEIGRAQAVQAEAAGLEPTADMNPVLLKPTTDEGSQVIVHGVARGNMPAVEYYRYKQELVAEIMESYDRLAARHDIIVLEGAGSPVELNLSQGDIVNMGLADRTDSPVILVGDIDRGGIFAQLTGTLNLLSEEHRDRVAGVVVNKFRGDGALFESGRRMLEDLCDVPVLGVVPYMDIDIDDEDSLSERLRNGSRGETGGAPGEVTGDASGVTPEESGAGAAEANEKEPETKETVPELKICVIRLPRISNYSDLTALASVSGVSVSYVSEPEEINDADAIVIPGTKSTVSDLRWLNEQGLADAIWLAAMAGTPVLGICGGFQMLGKSIRDPYGIESLDPEISGIGLLPIQTEYEQAKVTRQTTGKVAALIGEMESLSGCAVSGYEIHMGRSAFTIHERQDGGSSESEGLDPALLAASWMDEDNGDSWLDRLTEKTKTDSGWLEEITPFCQLEDESFDGCVSGNVMGTYLHGLFDSAEFTQRFLEILAARKEKAGQPFHNAWNDDLSDSSAGTDEKPEAASALGGDDAAEESDANGTGGSRYEVPDYAEYRQKQYDRLAEVLRESLDMDRIYAILGLEKKNSGGTAELDMGFSKKFSDQIQNLRRSAEVDVE